MCGRIGLPQLTWRQFLAWERGELDWDEVYRDSDAPAPQAKYNVAPSQNIKIAFDDDGKLLFTTARWGLIPVGYKGEVREWRAKTFNARVETVHDKKSFKHAWGSSRCVVPVAGYFEWTGEKGAKQPWWITAQTNAPCMYFAGLHSRIGDLRTATILTRPALGQTRHLHPRSPVMLSHQEIKPWVVGDIGIEEAQDTLGTSFDERLKFHKVRPITKGDDGPHLIEPI